MSKQNKSSHAKIGFLLLGLASFGLTGNISTQNAGWSNDAQLSYQGNLQKSNQNNNYHGNNQTPNNYNSAPQIVQQSTVTQTQTYTNGQPVYTVQNAQPLPYAPTQSVTQQVYQPVYQPVYEVPTSTSTYPTTNTNTNQIVLNGNYYVFQNGQSIVVSINGQITTGTVNNGVVYVNNQECNGTGLINGYIRQIQNGKVVSPQNTTTTEQNYSLEQFKVYLENQRKEQELAAQKIAQQQAQALLIQQQYAAQLASQQTARKIAEQLAAEQLAAQQAQQQKDLYAAQQLATQLAQQQLYAAQQLAAQQAAQQAAIKAQQNQYSQGYYYGNQGGNYGNNGNYGNHGGNGGQGGNGNNGNNGGNGGNGSGNNGNHGNNGNNGNNGHGNYGGSKK